MLPTAFNFTWREFGQLVPVATLLTAAKLVAFLLSFSLTTLQCAVVTKELLTCSKSF